MIYLVTLSFFAMLFFDPDITAYASTEQLNAFFFLHISPAFYLPIFFMSIPLLQTELSQPRLKQTAHYSKACIFVMQTLLFIFLPQTVSLRYLFGNPDDNWPWIQCVRHAQQQYHLQQGIGDYWSSRPLTLYAHLPMAQINSEFNPYYWLVDISTLQANTADFIVTDNTILINSNVIAHYGLPAQIIHCSSNLASLDLLIYPHGIPINLARD
jgi:hypothetical protein